jgi:hypothetical protein
MAPRCTASKIPESVFVFTVARARMASALPTAQPTRHPVML